MLTRLLFFILLFCSLGQAQEVDSAFVVVDSVAVDSTEVLHFVNQIENEQVLFAFYEKLRQLETSKNGKINIVHIGDSHIQADLFSGKMRSDFQDKFGNAGLGFSFPHNLAKTNGNHYIKYSSNASFENYRNVHPDSTKAVGLSGIALWTTSKNFAVELKVSDPKYSFNSVKIISPNNRRDFDLATASKEIVIESKTPKKILHKIKNGEVLSSIAQKYKVTVTALKKENGLKNDQIRAGKFLKIPSLKMEPQFIHRKEFIPLPLMTDQFSHSFVSQDMLQKIYLIPNETASRFELNGLILENNQPGIVYSAIGVNGAKFSDYNKFPLFFEQLQALAPQLIIVSLGTNESFDKQDAALFYSQLTRFMAGIQTKNPEALVLITTPPPSNFNRKYPNTFVATYRNMIIEHANKNNYAVWDLFQAMGGLYNVNTNYLNGLMSKDRVHYSKEGYEQQAELFFGALLQSYELYKSTK